MQGQWIAYDGKRGHWVPSEDGSAPRRKWHEVTEEMKDSAAALAASADTDDAKKAAAVLGKFALQSQNGRAINSAVDIASTLDSFRIDAAELDAAPHLLQCANGVVNLDTGELMSNPARDSFTRSSTAVRTSKARGRRCSKDSSTACSAATRPRLNGSAPWSKHRCTAAT